MALASQVVPIAPDYLRFNPAERVASVPVVPTGPWLDSVERCFAWKAAISLERLVLAG